MRAKVVFVVTGYGENVNGGVEQHCKMLAERLVPVMMLKFYRRVYRTMLKERMNCLLGMNG